MEDVGPGMAFADPLPPIVLNLGRSILAHPTIPRGDPHVVTYEAGDGVLSVVDATHSSLGGDSAGVSHLSAGFGIEGAAVEEHFALLPGLERIDRLAVSQQGDDLAGRFLELVPEELCEVDPFQQAAILPGGGRGLPSLPGLPGPAALAPHFGIEAFAIHL